MTISRKTEICGWSGLTRPGPHDTFPVHDERMRRFRRNHVGAAGVEVAVMMRLPLYIMPYIKDYGGSSGFLRTADLPRLGLMRRPSLSLFHLN